MCFDISRWRVNRFHHTLLFRVKRRSRGGDAVSPRKLGADFRLGLTIFAAGEEQRFRAVPVLGLFNDDDVSLNREASLERVDRFGAGSDLITFWSPFVVVTVATERRGRAAGGAASSGFSRAVILLRVDRLGDGPLSTTWLPWVVEGAFSAVVDGLLELLTDRRGRDARDGTGSGSSQLARVDRFGDRLSNSIFWSPVRAAASSLGEHVRARDRRVLKAGDPSDSDSGFVRFKRGELLRLATARLSGSASE